MKVKYHAKTATEQMVVYYETLDGKAEHYKQMILDGWLIDYEKSNGSIYTHWVRYESETFVKAEQGR